MPSVKELLAGMGIGEKPENKTDNTKEMTAEQLVELTRKATIDETLAELKSAGRLVDNPTSGNPNPGGGTGATDEITWATLDVSTEAGKAAFDSYLAEHGKTVFRVDD